SGIEKDGGAIIGDGYECATHTLGPDAQFVNRECRRPDAGSATQRAQQKQRKESSHGFVCLRWPFYMYGSFGSTPGRVLALAAAALKAISSAGPTGPR